MESELALYEFWNGYWGCSDTCADEEGLSYAADRLKRIVNYREMTMEDILRNENQTPWAWPTAMHFEKLYGEPPKDNRDIWTILSCLYNGKRYLFGIGKEEAVITEDMRKNGSWSVYTFSD